MLYAYGSDIAFQPFLKMTHWVQQHRLDGAYYDARMLSHDYPVTIDCGIEPTGIVTMVTYVI